MKNNTHFNEYPIKPNYLFIINIRKTIFRVPAVADHQQAAGVTCQWIQSFLQNQQV